MVVAAHLSEAAALNIRFAAANGAAAAAATAAGLALHGGDVATAALLQTAACTAATAAAQLLRMQSADSCPTPELGKIPDVVPGSALGLALGTLQHADEDAALVLEKTARMEHEAELTKQTRQ